MKRVKRKTGSKVREEAQKLRVAKTRRIDRSIMSAADGSSTKPSQPNSSDVLKQFKARAKRKMMAKEETILNFHCSIKDEYEKAASCINLLKQKTGILFDDQMLLHSCMWDSNYPEKPDRYQAILNRCNELGLIDRCVKLEHTLATEADICKLHNINIFKKLQEISLKSDIDVIEEDASNYDAIYFNNNTFNAARISSGCAIALVDAVCRGSVKNGLAIIRPPGHHATYDTFCGYCFFNNVAIATTYALDNKLANKILIVDFDVHHGQATQQMFYKEKNVLYFSIHRYEHGKFWPNLRESDYDFIGESEGLGYNINVPLNATGLEDSDYFAILHHILLPVAYEYQPDLIIVSAGYDACIGCPEGEMNITPGFYGHLITLLSGLAMGRIAVCLEGGYFLPSLAEGVAMTLKSLLGDPVATLKPITVPHDTVIETINNLKIVLSNYWNCFKSSSCCCEDLASHTAAIKYLGVPDKAPFLTRNCYPVASDSHILKYEALVNELANEYLELGMNQVVSVSYHSDMLLHNNADHVENSERLSATYQLFKEWGLSQRCVSLKPKCSVRPQVECVHEARQVEAVYGNDFDTMSLNKVGMYTNESTSRSAETAVGCLLAVVDNVMEGNSMSGVALIRPPGHHADRDGISGFCFLNNVAIAAQYMLDKYKLKKVLIVDFDVHHGDGTQNIFYTNKNVLYLSIHRYENAKFYPKTKQSNYNQCGEGDGEGYNVNIPINKDLLGNIHYLTIFHMLVLPIAYSYAPEVVLVSAGFDAGINDMLGGYSVTPDCYGHMVQLLKPLANGKLILALEGGYNITTVKYSLNLCIKTLLGDPLPILEFNKKELSPNFVRTLGNIIKIQKKYWPVLSILKSTCPVADDTSEKLPEITENC